MNGFSIKLSFVQQYNKQGVVLGRLNGPENKTLFFLQFKRKAQFSAIDR